MTIGFMLAVFFVYWYANSSSQRGGALMVMSSLERTTRALAIYTALSLFVAFCLFPFLWMIDTSLKPVEEVSAFTRRSGSSIRRSPTFAGCSPTTIFRSISATA